MYMNITKTPPFPEHLGKLVPETTLDPDKARDDGVAVASAGPNANNLHFVPESRKITMRIPHHSIFYRLDALPNAQVSKQFRHKHKK